MLRVLAAAGAGRRLGVARVGWLVLAAVVVALPVAAVPLDLAQLHSLCADASVCPDSGRLTPTGVYLLQDFGLSLDAYAALSLAVEAVAGAVWIAVGALVVWRRPGDPTALLTGWLLLAGAVGVAYGSLREVAAASSPAWALAVASIHMFAGIALGWFMAIFPDWRWVPG